MSFESQAATASDPVFQSRVDVAARKLALSVVGEAQGARSDAAHDKRHRFGVAVLNGQVILQEIARTVAAELGDAAPGTDAELTAALVSALPKMAGIKDGE